MINSSNQPNRTQNETSFQGYSSSECIAWLTVVMTESVAIATLNILTVIVFIKNHSLRKRSMYLVINLAVADIFVGGCSEIRYFVTLGESCSLWDAEGLPPLVYIYMSYLSSVASLTNLAAISLERAHATFRPFRHRIIKKWVFGFIITIIWVTSGLLPIAFYFLRNSVDYMIWSLLNGFSLFVICVSYVSIVVKNSCGVHPQHHGAASRERKLTKTLLIMTVVSLLLLLPNTIIAALLFYLPSFFPLSPVSFYLFFAIVVLFFANSLVNPILYAVRIPDFKRALVSLFRRHQRQVEIIPLGPI